MQSDKLSDEVVEPTGDRLSGDLSDAPADNASRLDPARSDVDREERLSAQA
jgi:hypothetical protein